MQLVQRHFYFVYVVLVFLIIAAFLSSRYAWGAGENRIELLEFTSSACSNCQEAEPLIQEMVAKGYPIRRVSMDDTAMHRLFQQYQVTAMPTFILLVDRREQDRLVGIDGGRDRLGKKLVGMFNDALAVVSSPVSGEGAVGQANPRPAEGGNGGIRPVSAEMAVPEPVVTAPAVPLSAGSGETLPGTSPEQLLTKATVRIRVFNENAVDRGTGTIIHVNSSTGSREALILTCGHLFRPNQGRDRIEVDVFSPESGPVTVNGQCIAFDDEIDVGFVGIPLPFDVSPVIVAAPNDTLLTGDRTISMGCSGGDEPTRLEHQVLSTDRKFFQPTSGSTKHSFHYVEVSNAPVGGRSGGGLFAARPGGYELVGVCNAGDPGTNEGYFVPLPVIYEQILAKDSLRFVYDELTKGTGTMMGARTETTGTSAVAVTPIGLTVPEHSTENGPEQAAFASAPVEPAYGGVPAMAQGTSSVATNSATALADALEELRKRQAEGAEIICVVNWNEGTRRPDGSVRQTEVIRMPKLSP